MSGFYSERFKRELNPIRVERRKRKWSVPTLAQRAGCSKGTIGRLERGDQKDIGVRQTQAFAAVFGVSWVGLATAWLEWCDVVKNADSAAVAVAIAEELEQGDDTIEHEAPG